MKKTYKQPILRCLLVHMNNHIMAGSKYEVPVISDEDFDSAEMTPLSRKNRNIWECEDEEEE